MADSNEPGTDPVDEIKAIYCDIREDIQERIGEFRNIWETRDREKILLELLFCILTPQSKARVCWGAVEDMSCRDLIFRGDYDQVLDAVGMVRFKYRKAGYIIEARDRFIENGRITVVEKLEEFDTPFFARDWLVENIKGYGYKEASHFLRNIGLGEDLAILDRHILKNLARAGIIDSVPSSITPRKYLEMEMEMKRFSKELDIPLSHLDLVLWYREAGEIFK
ncbi:MAG: N-glycosylase/DNA lyase [Thermoplasmatota archaeon]